MTLTAGAFPVPNSSSLRGGLLAAGPDAGQSLLQVISQRYDNNSAIILTSNKAFSDWAEVFAGDAIMASAALDRLLHRLHHH